MLRLAETAVKLVEPLDQETQAALAVGNIEAQQETGPGRQLFGWGAGRGTLETRRGMAGLAQFGPALQDMTNPAGFGRMLAVTAGGADLSGDEFQHRPQFEPDIAFIGEAGILHGPFAGLQPPGADVGDTVCAVEPCGALSTTMRVICGWVASITLRRCRTRSLNRLTQTSSSAIGSLRGMSLSAPLRVRKNPGMRPLGGGAGRIGCGSM